MKRITLTVFLTLSMLLTTGYQTVGEDAQGDSLYKIDIETKGYEIDTIKTEDVFGHYIKLAPKSIQVYFYTKRYCEEFNIPEEIAFAVAKLETGYKGPDRFTYNPKQTSSADALGPYQVLLSTGRDMYVILGLGSRQDLTAEMLLNDVELNVKIGIRYLRWLNDNISTNWIIACGFYNTGYGIVNQYARDAVKIYNLNRDV